MSAMHPDVVVIGAGIVGAACAYACAQAGLGVTVIDCAGAAAGATGAAMGHIVVMDDSEPQFALTRFSQLQWNALAPQLPDFCEFAARGTVWIAAGETEMTEIQRKHRFYAGRNVPAEILDAPALYKAEPNLRPGLVGALLVPEDSVVDPSSATQFLLETPGVVLRCNRVEAIREGEVRMAGGERLSSHAVINAAGVCAPRLTPEIAVSIRPRKGQLFLTAPGPNVIHHQLVEVGYATSAGSSSADSVAFNVQPRRSGQMVIGSSRQFVQAGETEIDRALLQRMLDRAIEFLPELHDIPRLRAWTGLRGATPDKLPLIGRCPGYERVFIAAGHEGLGITASLGTAHLIAGQILGRAHPIPIEPYSPARATIPNEIYQ